MHAPAVPPAEPALAPDRLGPVAGVVLTAFAALGLAAAWTRLLEAEAVLGGAARAAATLGAGAAVVLGSAFAFGRRLSWSTVLLAALSAAAVAVGLPDVPPWPAAATFGHSPWCGVLAGAAAALAVLAGVRLPRAEAATIVFLVLATAGGTLFARRADALLPLLAGVAAVGLWPGRGAPRIAAAPFLIPYALLLAWLVVPVFGAVDVDRHLTGWSRVAIAAFPLLVLGGGAPLPERAWRSVAVVLATVGAASVAAALTVGEAAGAFDLRHALRARLALFGVHPNLVAPFFTVALPIAAAALVAGPTRRFRFAGGVSLAAAGALLLLTRSRAAVLAGAGALAAWGALLVIAAVWRRRPRRSTVVAMGAVLALGAVGSLLAGQERVRSMLADSSMAFRLYLWGVATDAIAERPVAGYGLLAGEPLAAHATPSDLDGTSKNVHAHDVVLSFALAGGWPAAALYLALLASLGVVGLRVLPRLDRSGRVLLAAVVAAALGLFTANLLDLGLSSHTPIALHLGWMLGLAGLLVRVARSEGETHAPPPAARAVSAAFAVLLVLAFAWSAVALAGEAGKAAARRLLAHGDVARADRWTAALRRLNPHDLSLGMLRVQALRRAGRTAAEREELLDLSARHPLSPVPLEGLSALELARNRLSEALETLAAARRLDPTGPLAAEWSLRAARIEVRRGRREAAVAALSEAFRHDTQAARRVEWTRDGEGRFVLEMPGPVRPITLDEVLATNRSRLAETVKEDPVRARRAAAALAFTYRDFGREEEALAVIEEYEAYGGAPFVPLQVLRAQLREGFETLTREGELPPSEQERFHAPGDTAALLLAEGRKLAELGRPEEARARAFLGLAKVRDLASEAENLSFLADLVVETYLAEGSLDEARAASRLAIYAQDDPGARLDRVVRIAAAALDAGRVGAAAETLEQVEPILPTLVPGRHGDSLDALAESVARLDRVSADRLLATAARSGGGLALAARVHALRRDDEARREVLSRLRLASPLWAE